MCKGQEISRLSCLYAVQKHCQTKTLKGFVAIKASLSKVKAALLNECSQSHTVRNPFIVFSQCTGSLFLPKMLKEPILVLLPGSGLNCPPSQKPPSMPPKPMELHSSPLPVSTFHSPRRWRVQHNFLFP